MIEHTHTVISGSSFVLFLRLLRTARGILVLQPGIEAVPRLDSPEGPLCPSFKLGNFMGDWWHPPKLFLLTPFLCLRVNLNPWLLGSFIFWEQSLHTIRLFSNRISFFPLYQFVNTFSVRQIWTSFVSWLLNIFSLSVTCVFILAISFFFFNMSIFSFLWSEILNLLLSYFWWLSKGLARAVSGKMDTYPILHSSSLFQKNRTI